MEITRLLAIQKLNDAPDVVPEAVDALRAVPDEVWDGAADLAELTQAAAPWLAAAGCDPEELRQVLGRHVGEEWAEVHLPAR